MENTDLMIYNDSDAFTGYESDYSFAAVLSVIVGLLGVFAANGAVTSEAAEILPMVFATAVPGLFAMVLTYLLASSEYVDSYEEADEFE